MIIFKGRKRKQMIEASSDFIPGAIHVVELSYPKGQSPGGKIKTAEVVDIIKRQLSVAGWPVGLLTADDLYQIRLKVEDVHSSMSEYKKIQMLELKRQGIIREVPTLTVYRD